MLPADAMSTLDETFRALEETLSTDAGGDGVSFERSVDLRYRGQGYELNLPYGPDPSEAFHRLHQQRFGFCDRNRPLEIVTLRVRLRILGPAFSQTPQPEFEGNGVNARVGERSAYFDGRWLMTPIYARELLRAGDCLTGPALVTEYSSTTVLPPDCNLRVDGYGAMVIRIGQERENG